jgi:hypothetical protein
MIEGGFIAGFSFRFLAGASFMDIQTIDEKAKGRRGFDRPRHCGDRSSLYFSIIQGPETLRAAKMSAEIALFRSCTTAREFPSGGAVYLYERTKKARSFSTSSKRTFVSQISFREQ